MTNNNETIPPINIENKSTTLWNMMEGEILGDLRYIYYIGNIHLNDVDDTFGW